MTVLSLCTGYGGLDMAVQALTGAETAVYAEILPAACRVLEARYPGLENLGDITQVDWEDVRARYPDVDTIGAGFPCQDISDAGRRKGIEGEKSRVWKDVARAVGVLRPRLVFLENVAALRGRGLCTVAEDLAVLGYELRWVCVRASDVGAVHPRARWFGIARPETSLSLSISSGRPWRRRERDRVTWTTPRTEPGWRRRWSSSRRRPRTWAAGMADRSIRTSGRQGATVRTWRTKPRFSGLPGCRTREWTTVRQWPGGRRSGVSGLRIRWTPIRIGLLARSCRPGSWNGCRGSHPDGLRLSRD